METEGKFKHLGMTDYSRIVDSFENSLNWGLDVWCGDDYAHLTFHHPRSFSPEVFIAIVYITEWINYSHGKKIAREYFDDALHGKYRMPLNIDDYIEKGSTLAKEHIKELPSEWQVVGSYPLTEKALEREKVSVDIAFRKHFAT